MYDETETPGDGWAVETSEDTRFGLMLTRDGARIGLPNPVTVDEILELVELNR